MGAHRWSKTIAAYDKWSHIFDHNLPYEFQTTSSSLSVAMYLRDVIAFAHKHQLKGKEWYKTVTVSAKDENTIRISLKPSKTQVIYPMYGIFDLIGMHSTNELTIGLTFTTGDSIEDIKATLSDLGVEITQLDGKLCAVSKIA